MQVWTDRTVKTLQAIAFKSGMTTSGVTSGTYNTQNAGNIAPPPPDQSGSATQVFTAPAPRTVSYNFTNLDPLNRDSVTENGVSTNYTANKLNQYSNVGG